MINQFFQRWAVFLITAALFILSQFYRAAVAVITPQLIAELSLDNRGLSLISAAFFYAFALAQIPLAIYLDRIGARRTMTVLNLVAIYGAMMFAAAGSLDTLIVARLLLGIGMACNLMGTLKLISQWFSPSRFATLATVIFSLGTVGNIFASTPLVLMTQFFGWRISFVIFAGINLVLTGALYFIVRDNPCDTVEADCPSPAASGLGNTLSGLRRLFQTKDYWIISLGTFCRYGTYAAIQTLYAGPYLILVMGLSPLAAGNILFLMNLGFILGGPLFGALSDRVLYSRKHIVIPGLLGMAAVILALAFLPAGTGLTPLIALFCLLGAASSAGGIMYPHIKERMPPEQAGTAMTGINFFTMIGSALFLQGLGTLMQQVYPEAALKAPAFRLAFVLCAACLTAVAGIYLLTRDTRAYPPET